MLCALLTAASSRRKFRRYTQQPSSNSRSDLQYQSLTVKHFDVLNRLVIVTLKLSRRSSPGDGAAVVSLSHISSSMEAFSASTSSRSLLLSSK
jgi:hypothetical protein